MSIDIIYILQSKIQLTQLSALFKSNCNKFRHRTHWPIINTYAFFISPCSSLYLSHLRIFYYLTVLKKPENLFAAFFSQVTRSPIHFNFKPAIHPKKLVTKPSDPFPREMSTFTRSNMLYSPSQTWFLSSLVITFYSIQCFFSSQISIIHCLVSRAIT